MVAIIIKKKLVIVKKKKITVPSEKTGTFLCFNCYCFRLITLV